MTEFFGIWLATVIASLVLVAFCIRGALRRPMVDHELEEDFSVQRCEEIPVQGEWDIPAAWLDRLQSPEFRELKG